MALAPGTRLGAYEVVSLLGAGGMGEVYRAKDHRLNRNVALKVLPSSVASDPERLARFEREAQVLAALNHPNIAAIYGVEDSEGTPALVMELVDGETLADRIARGPIPLDDVLPIARQIAEALEAAHEQGIIHRDLKPANIKVRPDGTVKVLDFGLAKAMESVASNSGAAAALTNSPTITSPALMTGVGALLGTAAYMSPEQAKGTPADHRSDIFSFGVVLYEMLTGRVPFQGETVPDVLASVLAREPDLNAFPANQNPRLFEMVQRCLEKTPRRRWQAIGDVRGELELISSPPFRVATEPQNARQVSRRTTAAAVLTTAVIAGSLAAFVVWKLKPETTPPVTRLSLTLPTGQRFTNTGRRLVTISPNGQRIVYSANRQLFLWSLENFEPTAISGTQGPGVTNPTFSPDGQYVAFFMDRAIRKVSITGGTPTTLCPAENPLGMSWGSGGIVFSQGTGGISQGTAGIMRVAPEGGQPHLLVQLKDEVALDPQLLPDQKSVLFTVRGTSEGNKTRIVIQSSQGERKTVIEDGTGAQYLSTGHLVFARGGVLFAAPFDLARQEVTAEPRSVLEGIQRASGTPLTIPQYGISSAGSIVFVPGAVGAVATLRGVVRVDLKGARQPLDIPPGAYNSPRVSRDAKWLAVATEDGTDASIWIYDLAGTTSIQRLTLPGRNRFPIWALDGRITFQSDRDGDAGIFMQRPDGTALERLTRSESGTSHVPESWAPDGQTLLFAVARNGLFSLNTYSRATQKVTPFYGVQSVYPPSSMFSPDGKWVAYYQRLPGSTAGSLFVHAFQTDEIHEVSRGGGIHPFWSQGQNARLYYRLPTMLNSVDVIYRPTFGFTKPAEWPFGVLLNPGPEAPRSMELMPDGVTFVAIVEADFPSQLASEVPDVIRVVQNWFEELKARVPTK